jgi:acyl-CoA synthetase (AMP-forming)/AMP-acid ligase II
LSLLEALRESTRRGRDRAALSAGRRTLTYGEFLDGVGRRADTLGGGPVALDGSDPIAFLEGFFAARLRKLPVIAHPASTPEALRSAREAEVRARPWRTEAAGIFFSSGSVGSARAVPLSEENLLAAALAFDSWGEVSRDDCIAVGASPAQVFGRIRGALNTLFAGAEASFFVPRRDPLADAAALAASVVVLPSALAALAARHATRPPVRALRCGGGAVSESDARAIEERRGVPVRSGYGLTESSGLGSRQRGDRPRRPGSCGPPAPGMRVAIVGDDGEERVAGGAGEIRLQGPAVFSGYLSEADASPFDEKGRLKTGDVGAIDEAGELCVRGRLAFLLSSGGRVLCAEEVEAAIAEHPGVAEVAAVPFERAFGVLVVTEDPSDALLAHIQAHVERRLPAFARPRRILRVEDLPRTGAGKIDRAEASRRLGERP